MNIDPKAIAGLLRINDEQLGAFIQTIASEAGIDPGTLGLNPQAIADVRKTLQSATDQDLAQLRLVYEQYRRGKQP